MDSGLIDQVSSSKRFIDEGAYADLYRNDVNGTGISADVLQHFRIDFSLQHNILVLIGLFVVFQCITHPSSRT